ncbi:MAG: methyltransferase [Acidimicrobiales bacterium]
MTAAPGAPAGGARTIGQFWGVVHGLTGYFSVLAADELGVFTCLAEGPADAATVAARCGADPGRMLALLGGNVAAGALECSEGRFSLAPLAADHLVAGAPGYLGALLRHSPGPLGNWEALAATVRGAPPPRDVGREEGQFLAELVAATFPVQLAVARAVVGGWAASRLPGDARLLELGAGAAPWAVALLAARPGATAVVNDLPGVLPEAERSLAAHGVGERATLAPGSYWEVPLPEAAFDVAVLAHVCRAEGDEGAAALVRRAAGALAPGGWLLLAEYLLDNDLSGPAQAQLLGVTMAASTARGATFTRGQAAAWLEGAGLVPQGEVPAVPPTTVLAARKPGGDEGAA